MRVTEVQSARKDTGQNCSDCGEPVVAGQGYRSIKYYRGPRNVRHMTCRPFSGSEMTSNERLATVYRVKETIERWVDDVDESEFTLEAARTVMEDAAMEVDEVAEDYRNAGTNIEDGFGHPTEQSELFESNADELEDWAGTLREALVDAAEFDNQDAVPPLSKEEWMDEIAIQMQDATDSCPL
jgi:hypothetical protein